MQKSLLRPSTLAPLLALSLALAGCGHTADRYIWSGPIQQPKEVILQTAKELLKKKALVKEDMEQGTLEYEWEEVLHYFRFEGKRKKTWIKVENKVKGKPVFAVGVMIRVEMNENFDDPLDTTQADWTESGFDLEEENLVLFNLARRLSPTEERASSEYLEREESREELLRRLDRAVDEHTFPKQEPKSGEGK